MKEKIISNFTKKSLVLIMVLAMAFTLVPMVPNSPIGDVVEEAEAASTDYAICIDEDNVLSTSSDCLISGTVEYNQATCTLTLTNVVASGADCGIFIATNANIMINLIGDNIINAGKGIFSSYDSNLLITVSITGDNITINADECAIFAYGLRISDVESIKLNYNETGIYCSHLEIKNIESCIFEGVGLSDIDFLRDGGIYQRTGIHAISTLTLSNINKIIFNSVSDSDFNNLTGIMVLLNMISIDSVGIIECVHDGLLFVGVAGAEINDTIIESNSGILMGDSLHINNSTVNINSTDCLTNSWNKYVNTDASMSNLSTYSDVPIIVEYTADPGSPSDVEYMNGVNIYVNGKAINNIVTSTVYNNDRYLKYVIMTGEEVAIGEPETPSQSTFLYLPDPYVEAIDGTLHKSSEVNFYNEALHQKEVAMIQEEVKDWKVTVRTALAKKGIKLYAYLNGFDTEELYSYLDKGYTIQYDWYKAAGKNKKYKYVDSTDNNYFYDKDVKAGKTYFYKCKITIYDESGKIVRTMLSDCKYGCRKFK